VRVPGRAWANGASRGGGAADGTRCRTAEGHMSSLSPTWQGGLLLRPTGAAAAASAWRQHGVVTVGFPWWRCRPTGPKVSRSIPLPPIVLQPSVRLRKLLPSLVLYIFFLLFLSSSGLAETHGGPGESSNGQQQWAHSELLQVCRATWWRPLERRRSMPHARHPPPPSILVHRQDTCICLTRLSTTHSKCLSLLDTLIFYGFTLAFDPIWLLPYRNNVVFYAILMCPFRDKLFLYLHT